MKRSTPLMLVFGILCTVMSRGLAQSYKTTFIPLGQGVPGVLYEPTSIGKKAEVAIVAMHGNGDYLDSFKYPCVELSKRGYRVLCANAATSKNGFFSDDDEDQLFLNIKLAVAYLRKYPGVRKIVLFGHSGGGAMMASYQNIAENGLPACQGPEKLIKCSNALAGLPPADGLMLIDSTFGEPGSFLFSLDPAVVDEQNPRALDESLDMYNPKNGFDPKGSHYSDEFRARFFAKSAARMNRLIDQAEERLKDIEAGKGRFADDEPFLVPGSRTSENKLNSEDLGLWAHTRQAWPLLHADGTVTNQIVYSVRVPRDKKSSTPMLDHGATQTTVRKFLSTFAVRPTRDYGYDASHFYGIDFGSSYATAPNAVEGITKPLLQMGMTGSYEFFMGETIREHAKSSDKTLVYVEGAVHGLTPCTACALAKGLPANAYGDTVQTVFNYIDGWLSKPGRF